MWSSRCNLLFTRTQPYIHGGTPRNQLMRNYQEFWLDVIRGQKQASIAGRQTARGWVSCRKQVWPERWPRGRGICLSFGLSDGGTEQEWVAERPRTQKGNSCGWAMWWEKRSVRPQGASAGGGRVGRGKPPTVWQEMGACSDVRAKCSPLYWKESAKDNCSTGEPLPSPWLCYKQGWTQGDLSTLNLLSVGGKSHSATYLWSIQVNEK